MFVENEVNQVAKPKSTKNGKTKTIEETYVILLISSIELSFLI